MFEINLGTLLLATVLAMPGYIFNFLISKLAFPNIIVAPRKVILFLFSLIVSIALFVLLKTPTITDLIYFRISSNELEPLLPEAFTSFVTQPTSIKTIIEALADVKQFRTFASNLFIYTLILLTPASVVLAISLSIIVHAIRCVIKMDSQVVFGWMTFSIETAHALLIKSWIGKTFSRALIGLRKLKKSSSFVISVFGATGLAAVQVLVLVFLVALVIGVIIFLIAMIVLLLTLPIVSLALSIVLFCFHKMFSLFNHPWEDLFFKFNSRAKLPIVEAKTSDGVLYKGIFSSLQASSETAIEAITIKNIIKYSRVDERRSFAPENRTAYVFENFDGELTVLRENLQNFHVWHFDQTRFDWSYKITSEQGLWNRIWYLRLLLERYRTSFKIRYLDLVISFDLVLVFSKELLRSLHLTYNCSLTRKIIFRSKFRFIYKEFVLHVRQNLSQLRKNWPTLSKEAQDKLTAQKHELFSVVFTKRFS